MPAPNKTVLFVPGYWYQSLELFKELSIGLGDRVNRVFLETGDPYFAGSRNKRYTSDWFAKTFDDFHFCMFPDTNASGIRRMVINYRYQKEIKDKIYFYDPDLVITTSDRNNYYALLRHCCPETPIVIFQGGLLHIDYYRKNSYSNEPRFEDGNFPEPTYLRKIKQTARDGIKNLIYKILDMQPTSPDCSKGWGLADNRSYLFLWGPTTEALFASHRNNTFCAGNPLTDNLYNQYWRQPKNSEPIVRFGWDKSRKVILITAPCLCETENQIETIRYYKKIIENCREFNFIVKVHPRDDVASFEALAGDLNVVQVSDEYDFRQLLQVADLNISHYSATSLDAVIYGVPVVLLPQQELSPGDRDYWFGSTFFIKPPNAEACIRHIKELFSGSANGQNCIDRDVLIRDMFSKYAGHSTTAVINRITTMLQDK